ncbi:MAG: hypothetical protein Ct9H300mP11_02590 [Chloroflexota bacterium]|nr:MAG: hypothetical protein Ct9H300mP11_02590 [Chloroflexota bacterium]
MILLKSSRKGFLNTKVIDINQCCSVPDVVFSSTDSHEIVRAKMDHANTDYAIGVDAQETISRNTL